MYLQGKKTNDMQPLLTTERNSSFKTCFSLFCYFNEEKLHIEFLSEDYSDKKNFKLWKLVQQLATTLTVA